MEYEYHDDNTMPQTRDYIWVFGSNTAGRHGKGAAKVAHHNFAARYGIGRGRTGAAYAIATKDRNLNVIPLQVIAQEVSTFLSYAHANPKLKFWVTRVGCGLADYPDSEMAPLFRGAPANCNFARQWQGFLQ